MPLTNAPYTAPYGTDAAALYEILDPGTLTSGGEDEPIYDDGQLVQCVQAIGFGRELTEATLEGSNSLCTSWSSLKNMTFTLGMGGLDLDKWVLLVGATPSEAVGYSRVDVGFDDQGAKFGLIGHSPNPEGGDTHVCILCCQAKEGPGDGLATDEFYVEEWSGVGYKDHYNLRLGLILINHTENTDLSTAWPFTYVAGPPASLTGY